ncbi:sialate O-acetylesterase [Myroides odoratus]|uniref:sialate O-acetylesterase n=1 Tax=Myroides odoratus TaxID=256 RepID=UPI0033401C19
MRRKLTFLCAFLLLLGSHALQAQDTTCAFDANELSYDVILVAGQSNTHYGYPLNAQLDTVNPRVYELKRHDSKNFRIHPAGPVLDFWTRQTNRNSFATTFSNLYINTYLKDNNRKVLIIPCGYAGSSITDWTQGKLFYKDAMERVNYVLDNVPGSKLVAILWHQGEANVGWNPYQTTLDGMITDMRNEVHQVGGQDIPFIVGGMVPYWVSRDANRGVQQAIIKDTPNRVRNTSYADPEFPTLIDKPNNGFDDIHFDSAGQREMGFRYFTAYQTLANLNSEPYAIQTLNSVDQLIDIESNATRLYPNPGTDFVNLVSIQKIKQVEIYNHSQSLVFKHSYNQAEVTIAIANLPVGLYVARVTLEDRTVEQIKIIKK